MDEELGSAEIFMDEGESGQTTVSENVRTDVETNHTTEGRSDTLLTQQIAEHKTELERANRRIEFLENQLFTVERFKTNDAAINFYTGFPN